MKVGCYKKQINECTFACDIYNIIYFEFGKSQEPADPPTGLLRLQVCSNQEHICLQTRNKKISYEIA